MKKRFEDFAITKENRVKSEYLDLFSEKLNYNEVMFLKRYILSLKLRDTAKN